MAFAEENSEEKKRGNPGSINVRDRKKKLTNPEVGGKRGGKKDSCPVWGGGGSSWIELKKERKKGSPAR